MRGDKATNYFHKDDYYPSSLVIEIVKVNVVFKLIVTVRRLMLT